MPPTSEIPSVGQSPLGKDVVAPRASERSPIGIRIDFSTAIPG
jgi:hypothetical protein